MSVGAGKERTRAHCNSKKGKSIEGKEGKMSDWGREGGKATKLNKKLAAISSLGNKLHGVVFLDDSWKLMMFSGANNEL